MALTSEELTAIEEAREVLIETRSGDRVRSTVIWVAVDAGEVFVRSVRGEGGRWYQRAVVDPEVSLRVDDQRYEFTAVPADDAESVRRASQGFSRKYRGRSLDAMLLPEVLGTTLLLSPRD